MRLLSLLAFLWVRTSIVDAYASFLWKGNELQPNMDEVGSLQPAVDVSASLKRLVTANVTHRVLDGKLPLYVPSTDSGRPLVKHQLPYKFSNQEVADLNFSMRHGQSKGTAACNQLNTIFDIGFYDGTDSMAYLAGGYCVVGVEADPDLVAQAMHKFSVFIASGQLQMVNVALSPEGKASDWTVFYRNKCSKEWNSFYETVGCRSCTPPHHIDHNACDKVKVTATDCGDIFTTFGTPYYLKLDIEGAESGCFQALASYASLQMPPFVSAEITNTDYLDSLYKLGYQGFKLVRQDRLASATGSQTGPWGDNALDCRFGPAWRSYAQARQEMIAIMSKSMDINDACPGGIQSIHGAANPKAAHMWYDVHASRAAPTSR